VINEYDQIVGDLRPFWGIEPKVLRERVVRAAGNAGNDLAHLKIRNGKVEIASAPQWRVLTPLPISISLYVGCSLSFLFFLSSLSLSFLFFFFFFLSFFWSDRVCLLRQLGSEADVVVDVRGDGSDYSGFCGMVAGYGYPLQRRR